MKVYCMNCKKLGCEESTPLKTGFAVVNLETGEADAHGERVNVGFHAVEIEEQDTKAV